MLVSCFDARRTHTHGGTGCSHPPVMGASFKSIVHGHTPMFTADTAAGQFVPPSPLSSRSKCCRSCTAGPLQEIRRSSDPPVLLFVDK